MTAPVPFHQSSRNERLDDRSTRRFILAGAIAVAILLVFAYFPDHDIWDVPVWAFVLALGVEFVVVALPEQRR